MGTAQFVAIAAALVALIACAICVSTCWRASRSARKVRSMISLQGELLEIRDYLGKIDAWAKRINAREAIAMKREPSSSSSGSNSTSSHDDPEPRDPLARKEWLRRRAGIIPGRVVKHDH